MHPPHPVEGAHGSLFTPVPGEVFDTHRYYFRFRAFNIEMGLGNWRLTVAHRWHFLGDGDERWTSVDHGYYDLNSIRSTIHPPLPRANPYHLHLSRQATAARHTL